MSSSPVELALEGEEIDLLAMNLRKGVADGQKLNKLLRKSKYSPRPSYTNHAASKAVVSRKYYRQTSQLVSQAQELDETQFPFLSLPSEIRLIVYHELLVSDDRLLLTWRGPRKAQKQQKKMYIGILQTCKICSTEGLGVLYGENVFDFEEICYRPCIAEPLLSRIGSINPTLIRCAVAEYSAAGEELSAMNMLEHEYQLTISHLESSLAAFNIALDQLRVFAISVVPFGSDPATTKVMQLTAPHIFSGYEGMSVKMAWLNMMNDRLDFLVDGICVRETNLKKVDYFEHVHEKLSFGWSPPFVGRHWIAYTKEG